MLLEELNLNIKAIEGSSVLYAEPGNTSLKIFVDEETSSGAICRRTVSGLRAAELEPAGVW
jgi:hypothetical protein